ncbi:MAG: hypothetical protein WAT81_05670 [Candidatus Moraniibacteriota bacterium]
MSGFESGHKSAAQARNAENEWVSQITEEQNKRTVEVEPVVKSENQPLLTTEQRASKEAARQEAEAEIMTLQAEVVALESQWKRDAARLKGLTAMMRESGPVDPDMVVDFTKTESSVAELGENMAKKRAELDGKMKQFKLVFPEAIN